MVLEQLSIWLVAKRKTWELLGRPSDLRSEFNSQHVVIKQLLPVEPRDYNKADSPMPHHPCVNIAGYGTRTAEQDGRL